MKDPYQTLGVARGAAKWLGNQQTVNVPSTWVNELAVTFPTPSWLLVAPGVWLTLVLAIDDSRPLRSRLHCAATATWLKAAHTSR